MVRSFLQQMLTNSPTEEAKAESAKFSALKTVVDVDTVFSLLPENQEQKIPVLRSISLLIPELKQSVALLASRMEGSKSDLTAGLKSDPAYTEELIDVLQRIRFKMQDEQAAKWGASKPPGRTNG